MTTNAFFDWQTTKQFQNLAETEEVCLGEKWKTQSGRCFREAFIASRFAIYRKASLVRLFPPDGQTPTPDFAIQIDQTELWYEITEADRPGRKRGNEPPLIGVETVSQDEFITSSDYQNVVCERSAAKAVKHYKKCDGLVIYANAFPISDQEKMTGAWWRDATVDARCRFSQVWVFDNQYFRLIS